MRRFLCVLLAAVAAVFFSSAAGAAPAFSWSGFYVGANGGYASSRLCWEYLGPETPTGDEGCHDARGALWGGQFGYNWQTGSWVLGLEAQGDWANLTGSNVSLVFPTFTNATKIDALGLFTGRVGYAFNNVLLYAKAGGAVVHNQYHFVEPSTGTTGDGSEIRWGAIVGGGFEYGFAPRWSVGLEYNHCS